MTSERAAEIHHCGWNHGSQKNAKVQGWTHLQFVDELAGGGDKGRGPGQLRSSCKGSDQQLHMLLHLPVQLSHLWSTPQSPL